MSAGAVAELVEARRRYDWHRARHAERTRLVALVNAGKMFGEDARARLAAMFPGDRRVLDEEERELRRLLLRAGDPEVVAEEREHRSRMWASPFTRDVLFFEALDRRRERASMRPCVRVSVRARPRERRAASRRTAAARGPDRPSWLEPHHLAARERRQ